MNTLYKLTAVVGVAFIATFAHAELPAGCEDGSSMPADQFFELHDKLQNTSNTFPTFMRLFNLESYVNNKEEMKGYGFSPEQTVAIGSLFNDCLLYTSPSPRDRG